MSFTDEFNNVYKPMRIPAFRPRKRRVEINTIPFVKTDGGKTAEGFWGELRDCTVRSLALAAGITYTQAHSICASFGRKRRGGLTDHGVKCAADTAAKHFNLEMEVVTLPKMTDHQMQYATRRDFGTFSQVVKQFNKGRYIFTSGRHAFAVIDGVLHDAYHVGGRTRVGMIIRLAPKVAPEKPLATQSQINELWARMDLLERRI